MAASKSTDFLGASDSEDEQLNGYNSEDEIKKGSRGAKRRKISSDDDDDDDDDNDNDDAHQSDHNSEASDEEGGRAKTGKKDGHDGDQVNESKIKAKKLKTKGEITADAKPLTRKNLVATDAAIKKSGVVYISRVPPFMKPNKLRTLLAPYGTINRIFLAPEDPEARARRIRGGGNKRKTFTEGWVEFLKKKDAKAACELLNARPIGGKKGSYYHDDIWNLLYLKGFKWNNLTEQIASEDAERSSRMRAEISKTTRENKLFVRNVERAKMLDTMEAKAKAKAKKRKAEDEITPEATESKGERARSFRQISQVKRDHDPSSQPEQVSRVLSKIF